MEYYLIIIGGWGWVASLIMKTDKKMGLLANNCLNIGAVIGGYLIV